MTTLIVPRFSAHATRPFLPEERLTARTGGIEEIRKGLPVDPRSHTEFTIRGKLLEPLHRDAPSARPANRIQAPNFNSYLRGKWFSADLAKRYPQIGHFEMGHLWGPGFGDEAFAGLMWVPREVNQVLQSKKVEYWLRQLYEDTKHGSKLQVTATVVSWDEGDNISDFAREIDYHVTVDGPDNSHEKYSIEIGMVAPGSPLVQKLEVKL